MAQKYDCMTNLLQSWVEVFSQVVFVPLRFETKNTESNRVQHIAARTAASHSPLTSVKQLLLLWNK